MPAGHPSHLTNHQLSRHDILGPQINNESTQLYLLRSDLGVRQFIRSDHKADISRDLGWPQLGGLAGSVRDSKVTL
jgi:hypothetical protein